MVGERASLTFRAMLRYWKRSNQLSVSSKWAIDNTNFFFGRRQVRSNFNMEMNSSHVSVSVPTLTRRSTTQIIRRDVQQRADSEWRACVFDWLLDLLYLSTILFLLVIQPLADDIALWYLTLSWLFFLLLLFPLRQLRDNVATTIDWPQTTGPINRAWRHVNSPPSSSDWRQTEDEFFYFFVQCHVTWTQTSKRGEKKTFLHQQKIIFRPRERETEVFSRHWNIERRWQMQELENLAWRQSAEEKGLVRHRGANLVKYLIKRPNVKSLVMMLVMVCGAKGDGFH